MLPNQHLNYTRLAGEYCHVRGPIQEGTVADFNQWLHTANSTNLHFSCINSDLHPIPFVAPMRLATDNGSTRTFSDIADLRALEILKISNGREIIVLWSGGIDSQVVLTAFLRNGIRPTVACTVQSILENREFFDRFIHDKLDIIFTHNVQFKDTGKAIIVGTGVADNLVGGAQISHFLYSRYDCIKSTVVLKNQIDLRAISQYWEFAGKAINQTYAGIFAEHVVDSAASLNVDVSTWWQFWNFADIIYRASYSYWLHWGNYLIDDTSDSDVLNLTNWDVRFFSDDKFYQWALHTATLEDKVGTNQFEYKKAYKDYIYTYDKNEQYYRYKIKVSSIGSEIAPTLADGYRGRAHDFSVITNSSALLDQIDIANSTRL